MILQHVNLNYRDLTQAVITISGFKPNGLRAALIHMYSTTSVRYK